MSDWRNAESAASRACAACGGAVAPRFDLRGHRVSQCAGCGLYVLTLAPSHSGAALDRTQFEGALRELRSANYAALLGFITAFAPPRGSRLLDVGCSSGWFLRAASAAGFDCHGIEPDEFFCRQAQAQPGLEGRIVQGYFDRDLPQSWGEFDAITFNDVFEHLDDPTEMLASCRRRLAAGGVVALSLPAAEGFIFRTACVLHKLGITPPLERMFQIHYPYPHLFYFTRQSLGVLAERSGFELVRVETLPSVSARGALHRARMDGAAHTAGRLWQYANAAALLSFAAISPYLPADSRVAILRVRRP